MISDMFRILSYWFYTSFVFIESYYAFLFNVYKNQSWIWDTWSTSKMELFVTVTIGKNIFSW